MSTLAMMQKNNGLIHKMKFKQQVYLFLSFVSMSFAETGREAFSFLTQLTHTNTSGMAGAYSAKPLNNGDLGGISINPASLAADWNVPSDAPKWLSIGLRSGFIQDQIGYFAHSFFWKNWVWAVSLDYIYDGALQALDENGVESGGTIHPIVAVPSVTVAKELYKNWKVGGTFKAPSQSLGNFDNSQWAFGWGVDLGVQYQPVWKNVQLGMSFLNLGRQETALVQGGEAGEWLPVEWRMGGRYQMKSFHKAYGSLDYARPLYQTPYFVLGFEKEFTPDILVRFGTRWNEDELMGAFRELFLSRDLETPERHDTKLTGGTSIDVGVLWVDYAVLYGENLGWQHQVGVRWRY